MEQPKLNYEISALNPYIYISLHIIMPIIIMLTSGIGNGTVIYVFHKKDMINGSNNFVIAFAILDILSSVFIAPQTGFEAIIGPSAYHYPTRREIFIIMTNFTILSNLCLLRAVACDRVWAMYRPYTYGSNKRRHQQTIIALLSFCVVQTTCQWIAKHWVPLLRIIFPIEIMICILALCVTYPTIIFKLYTLKRKVQPQNLRNTTQRQPEPTTANRQIHVTQTSGRPIETHTQANVCGIVDKSKTRYSTNYIISY